jgi:aminotransferase
MLERSQDTTHRSLTSQRVAGFTESVIREMTRLAHKYDALNLAQGYPGFSAPEAMKRAAMEAIANDVNQYSITWGAKRLRDAIAAKVKWYQGMEVDPETMITVTCGATEGMVSSLMSLINPGDEVIIFTPFYENYGPDCILSGATPHYVTLREPDWRFDPDELAAAFNNHTKAIVINTPNNPTGKVFTREELTAVAELCQKWDAVAVTDEIYEHILYEGREHVSMATLPGMAERTVTVNGASKTYSVTGWRVGWVVAAPRLTNAIRKVHDFLTVGAPAPLQEGVAVALGFGADYYAQLARDYCERRDFMLETLTAAGFRCFKPYGAYYIITDFSAFGFEDDLTFAEHLVREIGIAAVPGSSFYHDAALGRQKIRFAYAKPLDILRMAGERLMRLRELVTHG